MSFTFEYLQTRKHGNSFHLLEKPADDILLEIVLRAEAEGMIFAAKLRATRYPSPEAWMKSYWHKENLIPVTPAEQDEAVC